MFGRWKKMQHEMARLETQIKSQSAEFATQLQRLRNQVAGLSNGVPIGVEAILAGHPFTEIPAEGLVEFLSRLPDVLLLDIRGDGPWESGHLANAKHVPAPELKARLQEMPDIMRPVVVIGDDGNDAIPCCKFLTREGYPFVFLVTGGMARYTGPVVASEIAPINIAQVEGSDRGLVERVAQLIDRDVRPGLIRDGGDLELVAVQEGVVKVRMVGACHGCGAQKSTLQHGIKSYITHVFPEIQDILAV